MKFEKDRKRWRQWLYQAKKRYGLCVLNYIVTSNHIHLLVVDTGEEVIPKSLQLIAGRTAQEFNARKKRKGAFWEDRYHATAVQSDQHLAKCLVYIDLNMVRAGVVKHPSEYGVSGYNELQNPPKRYSIINRAALMEFFSIKEEERLRNEHRAWIETELKNGFQQRAPHWSEAVAIGTENYIEEIHKKLDGKAVGRSVSVCNGAMVLKEPQSPYGIVLGTQKDLLSLENTYFLSINY